MNELINPFFVVGGVALEWVNSNKAALWQTYLRMWLERDTANKHLSIYGAAETTENNETENVTVRCGESVAQIL